MKVDKQVIPIQELPSGDILSIKTYGFKGGGDKKVYIQANIHGPELAGILVIRKLVDYFKNHEGNFAEMLLVPSCNPIGLNSQFIGQLTGYVSQFTGKNWNRIYLDLSKNLEISSSKTIGLSEYQKLLWQNLEKGLKEERSVESRLALTLQKISFEADIVVDLHTAWGKAPHYVYCYPDQLEEAKNFGVENIILLDKSEFLGVFDEANLYPYFKFKDKIKNFRNPKQVFTFELGSDLVLEEDNIELGFQELLSYLSSQGVLKDYYSSEKPPAYDICFNKDFNYYFAPSGGLLLWKKTPGEYFGKGEVLAEIYDLNTEETLSIRGETSGKLIIQFNSQALHEGQQVCKVMSRFRQTEGG